MIEWFLFGSLAVAITLLVASCIGAMGGDHD